MSDTVKPGIYTTERGDEVWVCFRDNENDGWSWVGVVRSEAAVEWWTDSGTVFTDGPNLMDLRLSTWRPFPQPEPAPVEANTVEVRVAVAMLDGGRWVAAGSSKDGIETVTRELRASFRDVAAMHILTARVPLPTPPAEIAATVEGEG